MVNVILSLAFFLHPFYISVTEMHYNSDDKSFEVSMKLFIDDIEDALEAQGTGALKMNTAQEHPEIDRYLRTYLHKNFFVTVDGVEKNFQFVGKEYEGEVVWCYLLFREVSDPSQVNIRHVALTDLFEEQQNIIHMILKGQKKSLRLHRGFLEDSVDFE